ncbi:hypothetical protein Ancab_030032 [Ancistrocladus abbreviatus]
MTVLEYVNRALFITRLGRPECTRKSVQSHGDSSSSKGTFVTRELSHGGWETNCNENKVQLIKRHTGNQGAVDSNSNGMISKAACGHDDELTGRRCLEANEGERSKGVQEGGVRDNPSCIPESLNAVSEALMNKGTNEQDDLINGFKSPSKKRVDAEGAKKDMGCEHNCTKHMKEKRARKDMGCGPNYLRHGEWDTKEIGGLSTSPGQLKEAAKGMEQDT